MRRVFVRGGGEDLTFIFVNSHVDMYMLALNGFNESGAVNKLKLNVYVYGQEDIFVLLKLAESWMSSSNLNIPFKNCLIHAYIHNWSLQPFRQDWSLVSLFPLKSIRNFGYISGELLFC